MIQGGHRRMTNLGPPSRVLGSRSGVTSETRESERASPLSPAPLLFSKLKFNPKRVQAHRRHHQHGTALRHRRGLVGLLTCGSELRKRGGKAASSRPFRKLDSALNLINSSNLHR
ncbi:hypothetical protein Mapa_002170 [Marchantia paleacea]|nr:hypothetical protein Mapa_002170 [Marchantia paleacea]